MPILNDEARALIASGKLAHCVTINPDGSPQVSCVWVGLSETDDDTIEMAHLGSWQKVKNLRRDPRVAITMEGDGGNAVGMQHYLVLKGQATVAEGGAPELLQKLARTYVGPDVKFPPTDEPPPGYVVRIKVEKVTGNGPWAPH
jgi:PPOX class probable F420-dependent enzyme